MTTYKELADRLETFAANCCIPDDENTPPREAAAILRSLDAQQPFEIDWPEYHSSAMGCGLEDRDIADRYEAMYYGWCQAIERVAESLPEPLYAAPVAAQASKPLSDDEMWDLWNAQGNDEMRQQDAIAFASAAITAFCLKNGIKERG